MICAFRLRLFSLVLFPLFGYWHSATAQDAAEMAWMLQDPLANIKALITDNDINFNAGNDQTSCGFQLQPVYAVSFDKAGFNLINRAVTNYRNASEGNAWTVPLGLGIRKTWALGKIGVEPLVGYYWNVVKPNGAADSSFKWAINFLF